MEDPHAPWERAFGDARRRATLFISKYNEALPRSACPSCGDEGHLPGIKCPACGYRHETAWAILRDTEWGYEVVPLVNRERVIATFEIDPPGPTESTRVIDSQS